MTWGPSNIFQLTGNRNVKKRIPTKEGKIFLIYIWNIHGLLVFTIPALSQIISNLLDIHFDLLYIFRRGIQWVADGFFKMYES